MKVKDYDRKKAVEYATKWAHKRNPRYYNFDNIGGDCTSFVSQCIYAGCNIMNYKKHIGWYYNSIKDRTASWSGVEFLYDFLEKNKSVGPRAILTKKLNKLDIGDIIQLKFSSKDRFSHSLIVLENNNNNIYVATHTEDAYYKNILEYSFESVRGLHITQIGIY